VDHLDLLKKDNAGAREAIRWLEAEFHKGNRYVADRLYGFTINLYEFIARFVFHRVNRDLSNHIKHICTQV